MAKTQWDRTSFIAFHKRLDPPVRRLARAVHPILALDRGRPRHVGSCVLLRVGSERFLLSAAHVFDEFVTNTLHIGAGGKLRAIKGRMEHSMPEVGERRSSDRVDAGVLRFEDGTHLDLDEDSFLSLTDVDARDHFAPKPSYLLFGYPAKGLRLDIATRHLTADPFRFVGYGVPPRRYLNAGVTPLTHVALDFNIRRSASKFGIGRAPKPKGVSGGGIWSVPALVDPRFVGEAKLVAIFTEFQQRHRLLIGSRVNYHFELMRARWPDIASLLPRHGVIDLDMEYVEPRAVDP